MAAKRKKPVTITESELQEAINAAEQDQYRRPPKRVAIVHVPGFISQDEGEDMYEMILDAIPNCAIIVMDGGKTLQIIGN